jgi:hypothetical protein
VTARAHDVPGGFLLGPLPAIAAAALAFNVYVLRVHAPGHVSGKLSDLAINFLLPLLVAAAVEWLLAGVALVRGRRTEPLGTRGRIAACVVSACYFSLLQIVPSFVELHAHVASLLDVPFGGARTFTRNVADLPDLLTLVTTVFAALYLVRRASTDVMAWSQNGRPLQSLYELQVKHASDHEY